MIKTLISLMLAFGICASFAQTGYAELHQQPAEELDILNLTDSAAQYAGKGDMDSIMTALGLIFGIPTVLAAGTAAVVGLLGLKKNLAEGKAKALESVKALSIDAKKAAEEAAGLSEQVVEHANTAKSSTSVEAAILASGLAIKLKDEVAQQADKASTSARLIEELGRKYSFGEEVKPFFFTASQQAEKAKEAAVKAAKSVEEMMKPAQ